MKTGIELIAQERKEQIEKHGYTTDHKYKTGELVRAACAIAYDSEDDKPATFSAPNWAWEIRDKKQVKKNDKIERLKVAGALLAAEIDRIIKEESNKTKERIVSEKMKDDAWDDLGKTLREGEEDGLGV